MPAPTLIAPAQLSRLVGLPDAPRILDIRSAEEFARVPRLIAGSARIDAASIGARAFGSGRRVVVVCETGGAASQGAAAMLRARGVAAESLEGGFQAWLGADGLLLRPDALPPRDPLGRTVWVTRARPKVDRIACPWLIRRFVDPDAAFLFVTPAEVEAVGKALDAAPFDIENVFWSHRGEHCTFDVMIEVFGLNSAPLDVLARIVRGADTGRPELAPEAAGLLAASLGLSRMYADDLAQLEAGLALYDAFYRWCRDAMEETHHWPAGHVAPRPARERVA